MQTTLRTCSVTYGCNNTAGACCGCGTTMCCCTPHPCWRPYIRRYLRCPGPLPRPLSRKRERGANSLRTEAAAHGIPLSRLRERVPRRGGRGPITFNSNNHYSHMQTTPPAKNSATTPLSHLWERGRERGQHITFTIACTLLTLTGCAIHEPRTQVTVAAPEQWIDAATEEATNISPQWWSTFGSPRLAALITQALQANPDLLLVPALGWAAGGWRLGYGGGFYDRTLAAFARKPFTAALCWHCGRMDDFAPEVHDVALDAILTEAGVVWPEVKNK